MQWRREERGERREERGERREERGEGRGERGERREEGGENCFVNKTIINAEMMENELAVTSAFYNGFLANHIEHTIMIIL